MKQSKSITRQKSLTNASKIILPFYLPAQNMSKIQKNNNYYSNEVQKTPFCPDLNKVSQISSIKNLNNQQKPPKSLTKHRPKRAESLTKLISNRSKKTTVHNNDPYTHDKSRKTNDFLLVEINNFKKYKHRSLSKQRSLTNLHQTFKVSQNCTHFTRQEQPSSLLKGIKKQRSMTKMQSQWALGRAVQKYKESQILHRFDNEKIDRNYDHLGKIKKSTLKKTEINKKFLTFKSISKQINTIGKQVFEKAQKEFNRKYHPEKEPNLPVQNKQPQVNEQNQPKAILSPKPVNKKYLKKSPSHTKNQEPKSKGKKDVNFRASADEQFLKARVDHVAFERSSKEESFFSEISPNEEQVQGEDIKPIKVRKIEDFSESSNQLFDKQRISQNQESIDFDKVYFFSARLSYGFATVFSIERINLKSKPNDNFIIEVVIKAYEQIVVQRIIYSKSKRTDTFRRQKALSEKQQQKQKMKNVLFSELMEKEYMHKNHQSLPQSLQMCSQKQNFQRSSQMTVWQNIHSIEGIWSSHNRSKVGSGLSSIDFSHMSSKCYQGIIEYIEKYCQLQVSYLGAYLKQSDTAVPMFSELMRKKHSQMQETLLQSLNLAKIMYFLIKINATYYIAKSVILGNRKVKYYVLYEFSNMIRHQRQCVIEEEEDLPEEMGRMGKYQLVDCLYRRVNGFFTKNAVNNFAQQRACLLGKTNNSYPNSLFISDNVPLINALEMCFGSIRQIGLSCDIDSQSSRLYKIVQSNFRNDIRWQKPQFIYNSNPKYENFFIHHNAFDYEILPTNQGNCEKVIGTGSKVLFYSSIVESNDLKERLQYKSEFSYTINKRFDLIITLHPNAVKSRHQLTRLHPTCLREYSIDNQFLKEQFLLLHLLQDSRSSRIQHNFLKKQYIASISRQIRQQTISLPLFTVIKNKKYYVEVYVPFLQRSNLWRRRDVMQEEVRILLESRTSVKRHSLKMTLGDLFLEMKEYYRLFTDTRSHKKFLETVDRWRKQKHCLPREFLIQKLKFYVSKLYLMKKNTYSQFYFVPLPNLISEASHRVSVMERPKSSHQVQACQAQTNFVTGSHNSLILHALQTMQAALRQQEKASRSTLSRIKIKNFPTYEIYYKTTRRLTPGYFAIISIYYMPIFDLSEIKFYLTKIQKSFYVSVKKNLDCSQYQNIIMVLLEFLKDRFFAQIIAKQSEKLSSKYKDFYSRMIRQAESPFISKTRKNREVTGQGVMHVSGRRNKNLRRNYAMNDISFVEMTEQLLCKVFQSKDHNKYLVRLSYPSNDCYITEQKRKGIDEPISISILKQNCMLIYKFQTTARKLLSKKVTHQFNVIQLEYQEKNKPFYILFEEIKTLIEGSDESTYGLLNTFRSYFAGRHYNAVTRGNFVSMFSINLLAAVSGKVLSNQNNLQTLDRIPNGPKPYHFDSQREINIKDLNGSLYQRYCLFIEGSQILEVLKIRKKNLIMKVNASHKNLSGKLPSFLSKDMKRGSVFERRRNRKQSIQANLASHNLLSSEEGSATPDIRMTPPKKSHQTRTSINHPKMDYFIEDSDRYSPDDEKQYEDSQRPQLDEKLVYLINTDTEHVTEIQSSLEDTGFAINVRFGLYNRRMFKRLFRNLVERGEGLDEGERDDSVVDSSHYRNINNFSLLY